VKSGHRCECVSRIRLFTACTVIYYVQFMVLDLPIQISQYASKYNWKCMHLKVATRRTDNQSVFALPDHHCTG